jgi:putative flippase GtrA
MKFLHLARKTIITGIDFFYLPFKKFIPLQTFRYGATGAANMVLDTLVYFVSYNFIVQKQDVYLYFFTLSPHIAAFFMAFSISFPTGFILAKYVTFTNSNLRGRIQLLRYGVTVVICVFLNYILLKLFVEVCHIYPTPSKLMTTVLVTIYSYLSQKHYTFKIKKAHN